MERIAVFPGSFDPFTIGHEAIVRRGLSMFDKIIVAIGYNANKSGYFPLDKRQSWIQLVFKDEPRITVETYSNLTVDFCKSVNSKYLLRGLRTASDFEYERAIAQMNKVLFPDLETIFMLTSPEHSAINSTIVRDIIRHGGDASMFLPKGLNLV